MARQTRYLTLTDTRNMHLLPSVMDTLGWPGNRSTQGTFIVAAQTKVEAAERANATMGGGPYRAAHFTEVDAHGPQADIIRALLLPANGTVIAYRATADGAAIVRFASAATDKFTVVAHFRRNSDNRLTAQPVETDPALLPTRAVPIANAKTRNEYVGEGAQGRRILFHGGAAIFTDTNDVWVGGLGYLDHQRAAELMSALAGALTELESRDGTKVSP